MDELDEQEGRFLETGELPDLPSLTPLADQGLVDVELEDLFEAAAPDAKAPVASEEEVVATSVGPPPLEAPPQTAGASPSPPKTAGTSEARHLLRRRPRQVAPCVLSHRRRRT